MQPCERKLEHLKAFKVTMCASEAAYEQRVKRCIEILPSAPRALKSTNRAATVRTSRHGLRFDTLASLNGQNTRVQ